MTLRHLEYLENSLKNAQTYLKEHNKAPHNEQVVKDLVFWLLVTIQDSAELIRQLKP